MPHVCWNYVVQCVSDADIPWGQCMLLTLHSNLAVWYPW